MRKKKLIVLAGLLAVGLTACKGKEAAVEELPQETLSEEEMQAMQESIAADADDKILESISERFPKEFSTVKIGDKDLKFPCAYTTVSDLGFSQSDEFEHKVPAHGQSSIRFKTEDGIEAYFSFINETDTDQDYANCTCTGMMVDDSMTTGGDVEFFDGITMDSEISYVKDRLDHYAGDRYQTTYFTYYVDEAGLASGITVSTLDDEHISAIYLNNYSDKEFDYIPVEPPFDMENETFVQGEGDADPTDFVVPDAEGGETTGKEDNVSE